MPAFADASASYILYKSGRTGRPKTTFDAPAVENLHLSWTPVPEQDVTWSHQEWQIQA